jgi:HEPN domain-containing protein
LKALLLFKGLKFPRTHEISDLLKLLIKEQIDIPEVVLNSSVLTFYAVEARYPDNHHETTEENYQEAIKIAEYVYDWVSKQIN